MENEDIILFSGGLDSFIAYYYFNHIYPELDEPKLLYVPLNHRYQSKEIEACGRLVAEGAIPEYKISRTKFNFQEVEKEDAHIPMRNLYLVLAAMSESKSDHTTVWLISQQGERQIPDRSLDFFTQTEKYINNYYKEDRMILDTLFSTKTKPEMVEWYLESGYPERYLHLTTSCYSGVTDFPCGECSACFRRWVAFELNDVNGNFLKRPYETKLAEGYRKRAENKEYIEKRCSEILTALDKENKVNDSISRWS